MAAVPDRDMLAAAAVHEAIAALGAPSEAESIVADYRSTGLTFGRHPLELLRPRLTEQRLMPARTLHTYRNG